MTLVNLRDSYVYLETLVDFLVTILGCEDDANSQNVIDFVKRHMLVLHLRPNAVRRFHAFLDFVFDAHLLQFRFNGDCEFVEQLMTLGMCGRQFLLDVGIFLRMLILEAEVLEFCLDLVQSQTVGQRRIDV